MRKFLLFVFLVVLVIALIYKSPFSALYNYNKAKVLYQQGQYEQSLPYFEKSLFADSKGFLTRFFYVMALSKAEPKYSVQKKLYEMSESKIDDEASRYAKVQVRRLRYKLLGGLEFNYIHNALMGNDILRWDIKSFPLRVYFENPESVPGYYIDSIEKAMMLWSNSTNFVKFTRVDDKNNSDIYIKFKDNKKECEGEQCRFVTAYTEPNISDKVLKQMTLTFYKTNPLNKGFTQGEIYNTALHELGHTLGIMGHSDNPRDLMFSMSDSANNKYYPFAQSMSKRDLQTLVLLYRLKPTISNVKGLEGESFYYPQLIIGNDDVRLQKKLEEYKSYINEYPEMASGYVNLASIYGDMGDFESVLQTLDKAETYAQTVDEKYIVNYNRAVTYYNLQQYEKAINFAKVAQAFKDEQSIRDLINDILEAKD